MNLNDLMVQRKIKFLIFKTHTIECRTIYNNIIHLNDLIFLIWLKFYAVFYKIKQKNEDKNSR
jgi:folate-binding Fe-S cluster repair protein YgfZ